MRISDWSSDVCSSDLAMMAFITSEMPEAMVRRRGDLRISADRSQSANGGSAAPPEHAFTVTDLAHRRSEEHTSELQSLMRISYAVFCLKKKTTKQYTR